MKDAQVFEAVGARPPRSGIGPSFDEGHVATPCTCVEPAAAAASSGSGGREGDQPRSAADDARIALHEASHATVHRLCGSLLGGMTCDPGEGFGGRVWGPEFESRFNSGRSAPSLCAKIARLMPKPGMPRDEAADVYAHVFVRVTELTAGT